MKGLERYLPVSFKRRTKHNKQSAPSKSSESTNNFLWGMPKQT